jgi:hypothetical protein
METIYTVGKYEVVYDICGNMCVIVDTTTGKWVAWEYMQHRAIKLANKLAEQ